MIDALKTMPNGIKILLDTAKENNVYDPMGIKSVNKRVEDKFRDTERQRNLDSSLKRHRRSLFTRHIRNSIRKNPELPGRLQSKLNLNYLGFSENNSNYVLIPIKPRTKIRTGKFLTKMKNACQKKLEQNYLEDNNGNNTSVSNKVNMDETLRESRLLESESGMQGLKTRPISMIDKRMTITQRKPQRTPDITLNSRRKSGLSGMSKETKPTTRDQKSLNSKSLSRYTRRQK